jgi:hypothetical protein
MHRKLKYGLLVGSMIGFFHVAPAFAVCPPGAVPQDPAALSHGEVLAQFYDNFNLHEEDTQAVVLIKGKKYWFAANGCPRMGRIGLSILDTGGKVLQRKEGSSPSFCFTAQRDGAHTVKVKALSLKGANTFGGIEAQLSESGCRP